MKYILTKRSAPSDGGILSHHVYGMTADIWVARAWYRATVTTDVIEIDSEKFDKEPARTLTPTFVSSTRTASWREEALKNELAQAKLKAQAK